MPEEQLLFVINPISGDIDKDNLKARIHSFMKKRGYPVDFFHTTGENDKLKLTDKIEELQPDTIVAVGAMEHVIW